jgi:hypothetical protein
MSWMFSIYQPAVNKDLRGPENREEVEIGS